MGVLHRPYDETALQYAPEELEMNVFRSDVTLSANVKVQKNSQVGGD